MRQLSRTTRLRAAGAALALLGSLAVTAATATAPASAHDETEGTTASRGTTPQQLPVVHRATKKWTTTSAAEVAGFAATDECVELPGCRRGPTVSC
ncbi:MAG: hypothetical protein ABI807_04225 [Sporichthyaceae bacterium]